MPDWPERGAPNAHRLHWAGTETAATDVGFMSGAIASGARAAAEVAADMRTLAARAGGGGGEDDDDDGGVDEEGEDERGGAAGSSGSVGAVAPAAVLAEALHAPLL